MIEGSGSHRGPPTIKMYEVISSPFLFGDEMSACKYVSVGLLKVLKRGYIHRLTKYAKLTHNFFFDFMSYTFKIFFNFMLRTFAHPLVNPLHIPAQNITLT